MLAVVGRRIENANRDMTFSCCVADTTTGVSNITKFLRHQPRGKWMENRPEVI